MTRETTPVAVIGVGHMGRHHARIYHELPQSKLVAVVDGNFTRAQEVAAKYGAQAFAHIDEMPDTVKAVTVAVPTVHHVAVGTALLRRGIDVLVEKPLAATVAEAQALMDCARECGRVLTVGHTERFNPVIRAVQALGIQPRYVETTRISPFSFRSADIGVVSDMMIHDIDIVLHLIRSRPVRVDAVGVNVLAKHEDVANARVAFENGSVATLAASRLAMKTERRLRAFSETAYLSLDYHKKTGVAITKAANLDLLAMAAQGKFDDISQMANVDFGSMVKVEPLIVDEVEPLRAELEAFLDSVASGKPPAVSAEDGVAAVRLAAEIVSALKTHRWS